MTVNYCLSIIILIISFLLLEKKKNKLNIIHSFIYSICLLFGYQTIIVLFFGFIGSLLYYSIINYIISFFLLVISYRKKRIQKYSFDRNELILYILILLSLFLVVWIRFRGFNSIIYSSDDSSIHYRSSLAFSEYMVILKNNHVDLIYNFNKMMPINYINGGFFIKIFSFIESYRAYMIYDSICLMVYSLLFLVIIFNIFKGKKYLFYYVLTMLYVLGFPLNNLVFGFGYLGLGVMEIMLLSYYIIGLKDNLSNNMIFNLVILFIINISLFFSYYLFVPFGYLALFIYYVYLYKKKKINLKILLYYFIFTLVIPFIIGFNYFILPTFFTLNNVLRAISMWGVIYDNVTPIYLFDFFCIYLLYRKNNVRNDKINFFLIIFYTLTIYVLIFLMLYILKISELYYFYKLFYVYWFFVIIYLVYYVIKKEYIINIIFIIVIFMMSYVYLLPDNFLSIAFNKVSIYAYNSISSTDNWVRFNKNEIDILEKSKLFNDKCVYNNSFLVSGSLDKKSWFYSITGNVPNINYNGRDKIQLYNQNITFDKYVQLDNYKCLIWFNDIEMVNFDRNYFYVLYENKDGVVLMKKES